MLQGDPSLALGMTFILQIFFLTILSKYLYNFGMNFRFQVSKAYINQDILIVKYFTLTFN